MQKRHKARLIFAEDLCFWLFVVVLFTMSLTAAEIYVTNGQMLADTEIANGSPIGDITVAIAVPK
jgi:hypothetical protein